MTAMGLAESIGIVLAAVAVTLLLCAGLGLLWLVVRGQFPVQRENRTPCGEPMEPLTWSGIDERGEAHEEMELGAYRRNG